MVDCRKRQKEIYKGTEQNRCINKEAELHLEIVDMDQCAACPVRVLMQQGAKPCEANRLIAQEQKIREQKANQLLVINPQDGDYPQCPFRYEHKSNNQYCSITGLEVNPEICNRCDAETREHEAEFGDKVKNYFGAIRRWVAMGRPTRSQEEINELFENHCKGCERYDKEKHACKNCGCTVSTDSHPLANKLAMKSEHCPLGRF
jgi:hypothetical protein